MLRRRRRLVVIAVPAVLAFLAISLAVAGWLSTENRERDRLFSLVRAEAAHDAGGVVAQLEDCDAACAAKVRRVVARIPRGADVRIVLMESATAHTLGTAEGWTRLVWVPSPKATPLVQCVRVRREGGPATGRSVSLLRLTAPLADNEASC